MLADSEQGYFFRGKIPNQEQICEDAGAAIPGGRCGATPGGCCHASSVSAAPSQGGGAGAEASPRGLMASLASGEFKIPMQLTRKRAQLLPNFLRDKKTSFVPVLGFFPEF